VWFTLGYAVATLALREFKQMDWLARLTQRHHDRGQRIAALLLGQLLFLLVFPCFIVLGASYIDGLLGLPRFTQGLLNGMVGLLLISPGLVLVEWTVKLQLSMGGGTPIPIVATRRLITKGPYSYSRNPMATGTTLVYVGIAVWVGSLSAAGLALVYPAFISAYTKLFEEKELEGRFGSEYVEYKKRTPFVIPRLPRRG
jgi:protein-S-isoprenylcysteine O-methyltransferase Ste14